MTAINSSMVAMNKKYGITKVFDQDTKKLDIEGNIFGIDFSAIKEHKKCMDGAAEAIIDWNNELEAGKANIDSFNCGVIQNNIHLKDYLKTTSKDAPASLEGYRAHLQKAGISTDTLRLKTILLNSAITLLGGMAIQAVFTGLSTAIDNYIHRVEKAKEALSSSVSTYESTKSELESITSELATQGQRLDELNAKDNLTYAEKGELEELRRITQELELQKALKDEEVKRNAREVADNVVNAYNTQYNAPINDDIVNASYSSLSNTGINESIIGNKGNLNQQIAAYKLLSEQQEKTLQGQSKDYQEIADRTQVVKDNLYEQLQTITDYRKQLMAIPYNELDESQRDMLDRLDSDYAFLWKLLDPNKWNGIQIDSLFDTEGIEVTKDKLIELAKAGKFDEETLNSYPKLKQAIEDMDLSVTDGTTKFQSFTEHIKGLGEEALNTATSVEEMSASFTMSEYEETIDGIQSAISKLRSALDSLNKGELGEEAVLDLMQEFPQLIPYVDLAADGFGNLSQGLSELVAQQPDALISSLESLKEALNTEEERAQVDALVNSLQGLSSYGDTGMEAYAASIGSTWNDTANVIEGVTNQFENLAKVQEAVSNGLTMSATAASELAKMYPEILTNATVAANGQITLNGDVVRSILEGDSSIIDGQIAKLEADKAVLTSKKAFAEAQLNILKQVGEGEGKITKEVAQYRVDTANQLLQALIEAGVREDEAYAAVAEAMSNNTQEFGRVVADVAEKYSINMNNAASASAQSVSDNSVNMQVSLNNFQKKISDVARSLKAMAKGEVVGSTGTYGGGGSTSRGIKAAVSSFKSFTKSSAGTKKTNISLNDFQSQLELDIKGYTDAISNIDSQIAVLKNLQATFTDTANSANGGIGGHDYADKIKSLEKEKDKINSALDDAKSGGGSTDSVKDEYAELFDFFERRAKVLNDILSFLKTGMDNVVGSFAKNQLVDAELDVTEEKFRNYTDALAMYTEKANEALSVIPADMAQKVKDGAVDLTTFIGEGNEAVVEAIKNYEQWADKVTDCTQQLEELKTAIRQLELEKFNNIMDDFTDQFNLHKDGKDLISKQIDLLKEAGELIGESFYSTQIDQSRKQLELLGEEKAQLVGQLTDALYSGRIEKSGDEWLEMVNALSDVEGNILDCQKAIEQFDNELLNLNWGIFERIQTEFGNISSELGNLAGLFDEFNDIRVSDGKGAWTREAIATLGLYAQQYEVAKYQISQYADAIDKLNEDYASGKYSATEYAEKLADLTEGQWDAVNSAESLEDAIVKLNETRVNEEIDAIEDEIDAYKKLTDAQIDALEAEKDLHDYRESIAEKTKKISDIERQLAAMQNDGTASTIAKRKKLEEQLAEAKHDLSEAEYDHSIESQKDALDKQYNDFESARNEEVEALRATLENREALISASFDTVKDNANIVGQEIAAIATEHGVTISNAIITSWQKGEKAIASYGDVLSAESSAFIRNIMGVEDRVYSLQSEANATADTLSDMFATRADALVYELTSSYQSEENLNNMTQVLQNSLINTLERGYNIGSLTNAFNSIISGASEAANAANRAASAISNMNSAGGENGGYNGNYNNGQGGMQGKYRIVRSGTGNVVKYGLSKSEADKLLKRYGPSYEIQAYAKGGIVTKDDNNPLNEIAKAVGEDTLIAAKEGESVLTAEQTEMIKKTNYLLQHPQANTVWNLTDLSKVTLPMETPKVQVDMPKFTKNERPNVSMNYGSLITINGDVNDTNHFLRQIEGVSQKVVNKTLTKIDKTFKYR